MSTGIVQSDSPRYRRRTPETEVLYQTVAGHLETFLARIRSSDRQLPRHVEQELRAYLECGILAHGFLRLRCGDCGESRVVAFSQVEVTECPACGGRLKIVAALTDPVSVWRYLEGVGLPSRAPPVAPAQLDRQLELDDAA